MPTEYTQVVKFSNSVCVICYYWFTYLIRGPEISPLTGYAPGPHWGLHPQTPVIDRRFVLVMF